jgi:hypothetical protein
MTTIGDLISELFTKNQQQFHDDRLAAVATQVVVDELLRERQKRATRVRHARQDRKAA